MQVSLKIMHRALSGSQISLQKTSTYHQRIGMHACMPMQYAYIKKGKYLPIKTNLDNSSPPAPIRN